MNQGHLSLGLAHLLLGHDHDHELGCGVWGEALVVQYKGELVILNRRFKVVEIV